MKKTLITFLLAVTSFWGYAKPDFEIPDRKKYETAEECRKDNDIALKTAKFYLDAQLQTTEDVLYSLYASKFLIVWAEASDEILISLGEKRCPFMACKNDEIRIQLLTAYIAGCVIYCLENKQKEHDFNMHFFALTKTMEYYDKNRSISGSDKEVDKLLKDFKKSNFKEKEQKKFK